MKRAILLVALVAGCARELDDDSGIHVEQVLQSYPPFLTPSEPPGAEETYADFNGDGRVDLVHRGLGNGIPYIFFNNGSGFSYAADISPTAQTVPPAGWDVMFADMNGDGRADLVNHDRSNGNLFLHYNQGGTGFAQFANLVIGGNIAPWNPGWRTILSDINDDGYADICNINQTTGTVYVHLNQQVGFGAAAFVQTNLAVPSSPFTGWEQHIADLDGDGFPEFINFNQNNNSVTGHIVAHKGFGTSFAATALITLTIPRERYETEYFFADFSGDGIADVIQHDLRTGVTTGYRTFASASNTKPVDGESSFRYYGYGSNRHWRNHPMIAYGNRSLDALMLYDVAYLPWARGQAPPGIDPSAKQFCPTTGWWPLNPNEPNNVTESAVANPPCPPLAADGLTVSHGLACPAPAGVPYWSTFQRRTTATPALGFYRSSDPNVIKAHAYWMAALGASGMVVDLTNVGMQYTCPNYDTAMLGVVPTLLQTLQGITSFVPPRVVVAVRYQPGNVNGQTSFASIVSQVYAAYQQYPAQWYRYHDGEVDPGGVPNHTKPLLLVFVDDLTVEPSLTGIAPALSHFNVRFTNGSIISRQPATTLDWTTFGGTSSDNTTYPSLKVKNNMRFWNFWENTPNASRPGFYKSLYRVSPAGILEQSAAWVSMYRGDFSPQSTTWDGMYDLVNSKTTWKRSAETVSKFIPRIALVNRFNYPLAWWMHPGEGLSYNRSGMIEPIQPANGYTQFKVFDDVANTVYSLRQLNPRTPGAPVVSSLTSTLVTFSSNGFPTRYMLGNSSTNTGWLPMTAAKATAAIPPALSATFWIKTANSFGSSAQTLAR